jgi:hypothetical protein
MSEAETTQRHYLETKGTESFIEPKDGEFLVYRTSDKKVLKSVEYSPADIKGLIANE